jgi:arylsulfatase A-like enzyme
MVAPPQYFSYYYENRTDILVSPSMADGMSNSAYKYANTRRLIPILGDKYPYNDPSKIVELTASYYAMIEEIDSWVGKIMKVVARGQSKAGPTLLIFTSDHGEMMGAHGMLNKAVMLEEATRVPLIMSLPGTIPTKRMVKEHVSQMDLHATILDYCQASAFDQSTGKSLRRFIDQTSANSAYDERVVVVELDERFPVKKDEFSKPLGQDPNFMVRKGNLEFP